jgi:hypothetical protein
MDTAVLGWENGFYVLHTGWWGPHVGFYSGIMYGFGYFGEVGDGRRSFLLVPLGDECQSRGPLHPGHLATKCRTGKAHRLYLAEGIPAVSRFIDSKGNFDWMQGMGSIVGVTNYKFGAEERLKANEAKARDYSRALSTLAERDPEAASPN